MKYILSITFFMAADLLLAQFTPQSAALGETTTAMQAISIGNVLANADIRSRLHINNFYCSAPTSATFNGFLFRSDGDQSVENR